MFVSKCVDAGAVTGTKGIEAIKEVVDAASVDDNPLLTECVAEEGCCTHDNPCKLPAPSSFINGV